MVNLDAAYWTWKFQAGVRLTDGYQGSEPLSCQMRVMRVEATVSQQFIGSKTYAAVGFTW